MLRRWVVGCPVHWAKGSLTGDAAPELLLHFLPERCSIGSAQPPKANNAIASGIERASSAYFMKRRFHCKKVEGLKCRGIVILSEAKNL